MKLYNHYQKKFFSSKYRWIAPATWMGVIFFLSSLPSAPSQTFIWWDFLLKKLAHMVEYGLLAYLLIQAIKSGSQTPLSNRQTSLVIIFCLLYAISDEIHQSFTPFRHPKATDVGYDMLGTMIAVLREKRYI